MDKRFPPLITAIGCEWRCFLYHRGGRIEPVTIISIGRADGARFSFRCSSRSGPTEHVLETGDWTVSGSGSEIMFLLDDGVRERRPDVDYDIEGIKFAPAP